MNISFQHESKKMTPFLSINSKNNTFLHKIHDSKNKVILFGKYMTQRIDFFFQKKKELRALRIEPGQKYDSKNWTLLQNLRIGSLFTNMTHSKKVNPFWTLFQHDSKNWTLLLEYDSTELKPLLYMSQWIEPFFWWLKELNLVF